MHRHRTLVGGPARLLSRGLGNRTGHGLGQLFVAGGAAQLGSYQVYLSLRAAIVWGKFVRVRSRKSNERESNDQSRLRIHIRTFRIGVQLGVRVGRSSELRNSGLGSDLGSQVDGLRNRGPFCLTQSRWRWLSGSPYIRLSANDINLSHVGGSLSQINHHLRVRRIGRFWRFRWHGISESNGEMIELLNTSAP